MASNTFLTAKVKAKHRGRNGVNGASQNAQHVAAIPYHHALPVNIPKRTGTQTSQDKTRNTIINIIMLLLLFFC